MKADRPLGLHDNRVKWVIPVQQPMVACCGGRLRARHVGAEALTFDLMLRDETMVAAALPVLQAEFRLR
jgi:hypothetical protein